MSQYQKDIEQLGRLILMNPDENQLTFSSPLNSHLEGDRVTYSFELRSQDGSVGRKVSVEVTEVSHENRMD